jgi:putative IMPACT (imprinted ancient) family translation regulator
VGSPLRLLLAVGFVSSAIALGGTSAATAASASSEDDARATANAFIDALAHSDAQHVCALFSPDAISRFGGPDKCLQSMTSDDEDEADYAAMDVLERGYTVARLSATKRKGQFVTKKFGARKLAHDMEQLDPT